MEATFTKNRIYHQQATPAEVTGELPVQVHGNLFGGRDDQQDELGWSGNLDAPTRLPSGGMRAVFPEGYYEGTAARNYVRGE